MIALALAGLLTRGVLTWNQPYPADGTPVNAWPDAVRCYENGVLYETVPNNGECRPVPFACPEGCIYSIAGFNAAGESEPAVLTFCQFEIANSMPDPETPGIQVWAWIENGQVIMDRSELISCFLLTPPDASAIVLLPR